MTNRGASFSCWVARLPALGFALAWIFGSISAWVSAADASGPRPATVAFAEGTVEFSPSGNANWYLVGTNQVLYPGDQLRTAERSRATLRLHDLSILPIGELSTIRIQDRPQGTGLLLLRGILSFFHRDRPGDIEVRGGSVSATIRGTEFVFSVDDSGTAALHLFDGAVELTNSFGRVLLESGDIAQARPGEPPRKTASLVTGDLSAIQWALYYPAILDLADLGWTAAPDAALQPSLDAYRTGHLLRALTLYPAGRSPARAEEKVFLAALLFSVGSVPDAERWLNDLGGDPHLLRLASALRQLIATVKRQPCLDILFAGSNPAQGSTELLAQSYCLQGQGRLHEALQIVKLATDRSPSFGFAWARRAELEFSFGRIAESSQALERALALTPENAEALALMGFTEAARNRVGPAGSWFKRALAIDGALGNAWLGLGLSKIRTGDLPGGRADLEVAAAVEPQRALLRSYLAKAFLDEWRLDLTARELDLAVRLDPKDPTPWLYRSLLDRNRNRVNDAIRDLAQAQELTGQRALYRSQLLLDQDRAVAAANQALAFRDAGMAEVGLQTASRSVTADYSNPAAHQFLADSYASADRIDLRYETPRVSEYLLANLLAPVGGGILSASVSQQEYSKLFERDGFGLFSDTTYRSRGAWTQSGGGRGTFGHTSFLAEAFYESDPGHFANNDLEQTSYSIQLKEQVGAQDTFYAQALYSDLTSGDLARYYNPSTLDRDLRVRERLNPLFLAGWHRQWSPDSHTLFLAGLLQNTQEITDPTQPVLALETDPSGAVNSIVPVHIDQRYQDETTIFTVELQQLWQNLQHTAVGGLRYQYGQFDVHNDHGANDAYNPLVLSPGSAHVEPNMQRFQAYAYDTWHLLPTFHLVGGLSVDYLEYPINFQYAPVSGREDSRARLSPKAGFLWEIAPRVNLRGAYTRSLGGVGLEQSFRLEPTQVAGFNQAYRSLIPESIGGVSAAPVFETAQLALELRPWTNTWLSLSGERLASDVRRQLGTYLGDPNLALLPTVAREDLSYEEDSVRVTVDQLIGPYLALGAHYRLSWTELSDALPDLPSPLNSTRSNEALLHQLHLSASVNHPIGLFGVAEAVWYRQENRGSQPLPNDDFWQINLVTGYRFAHRHAEAALGILNVTGQDYRLNPLSLYAAPERERTFFARLRWSF